MTQKKIILINPLNKHYAKRLFPPLSLTTIASHIPPSYDVEIIDENLENIHYNADLIAISVNTYTARRSYEIACRCHELKIPAVLGGIHPTILPKEAAKYATNVVIGESEDIWIHLLQDFEKNQLKKYYRASLFNLTKEKIKIPRRELLNKRYFFESIETVRGCPFNCSFCSVTRFYGGKYRFKPLEMVAKEIESLNKTNIFIVDDNLIGYGDIAEKRTIELLRLLKEYNVTWMGQASINIAENNYILRLAKDSGCVFLFLGFESINRDFLSSFNKHINLKKGINSYKAIINKLHDYGINIMGSFIIGSDFDTKESLLDLKNFIIDSGIDIPNLTILTPYPGTKLYNDLLSQQRLFNPKWWLEVPLPLFTFSPLNIKIKELACLYYNLITSLNGLKFSIKRFFSSLFEMHSLKNSMFSFTENLINGNIYKRIIKQYL